MAYILGLDIWEGNPALDEPLLKAAGVEFLIIRLNHIGGGHHIDETFASQWAQATPFVRWPYFVYNPWKNGRDNFDWLAENMPADAHAVGVDVEVRKDGYSPEAYADEVDGFANLAAAEWNLQIYTGAWFLPFLAHWPMNREYWWGRYPYSVHPNTIEYISWATLTQKVNALAWAPGTTPGPCRLWQCTCDRYIMPGCGGTCVDVNIWKDTREALIAFAGNSGAQPPPVPLDWKTAITVWARTRGYTGPGPEAP